MQRNAVDGLFTKSSTFNHHAANFTAVAYGSIFGFIDFFKIPSSYPVDFKAFRTVAAPKLIFRNGKMAAPTAQPAAFARHQRKDLVLAGFHNVMRALPYLVVEKIFFCRLFKNVQMQGV